MEIEWITDSIRGRILEYPIPVGSGLLYILSNVEGHGRLYLLDALDGESPLPWWIYNLTIWDAIPWRTTNGLVQESDFLVGVYVRWRGLYYFASADLYIEYYDGQQFKGNVTGVLHQCFPYFGINGISGALGLVFFTGYDYATNFMYLFMLTKDQFLDPDITIDDVIHVSIPFGNYPWAPLAYGYSVYAFGMTMDRELIILRAMP